MRYLVVAYPEISRTDFEKIQGFRAKYSKLNYHRIQPHFTLVFSFAGIELDRVIDHIKVQLQNFKPFEFSLDKAVATSDADGSYIFLVPGTGYEIIQNLHDRLYTGILSPELRLDVPFTPHLTIGNGLGKLEAQALAESLNEKKIIIPGQITELDLILIQDEITTTVKRFAL